MGPKDHVHDIYHRNKYRLLKAIPIIGIIFLLGLYFSQKNVNQEDVSKPFSQKIKETLESLKDSFNFSNKFELFITFVAITTLWTGYKYWLQYFRYIRKNSDLLEKLVIVIILLTFIDRHIYFNSTIGFYLDWLLFLLALYLVVAGTWFLAKTIDGIDLSSDLYCWGLRILGIILIFFGFLMLSSSSLVLVLDNHNLVFNNIYWILSLCVILLGLFMDYRSFRRHPAIHVW